MKVRVLKSDYAMINAGMEGEATPMAANPDWFEVLFSSVDNPVPGYHTKGDATFAFKRDQLEFLENELPMYPEFVRKLCKPGAQIRISLTDLACHKWHMASAICGEAGELFDAIKRDVIYEKIPDRNNIIEELGDLEFYMEGLRQAYVITREETIKANQNKLSKRYHTLTYQNSHAQERADKLS